MKRDWMEEPEKQRKREGEEGDGEGEREYKPPQLQGLASGRLTALIRQAACRRSSL